LSPVTPLGTCGVVGPVSQNRVVSTVRGTEVVSDSTNALAVEAATRRRDRPKVDKSTWRRVTGCCVRRTSGDRPVLAERLTELAGSMGR
jgi:hypothetical protein